MRRILIPMIIMLCILIIPNAEGKEIAHENIKVATLSSYSLRFKVTIEGTLKGSTFGSDTFNFYVLTDEDYDFFSNGQSFSYRYSIKDITSDFFDVYLPGGTYVVVVENEHWGSIDVDLELSLSGISNICCFGLIIFPLMFFGTLVVILKVKKLKVE